ncbi:MAG: hypothetical protein JW904_11090 [Spirochaetales bacterium]|nr:hypothetical protein [Spirochaetales bacterium]
MGSNPALLIFYFKVANMGKLELIIDKLNKYLLRHSCAKIPGNPEDLDTLYESALRSIWKLSDLEERETMAIEIAKALSKYFGGKNLEEAYRELVIKLNEEEAELKKLAEEQEKKQRMSNPDYVPSFDELFENDKK